MSATAEQARAILRYDEESGALVWRHRPRSMFTSEQKFKAWNTRYAGKTAGCTSSATGYVVMSIFNRRELAHRVAWLIKTGEWPELQIDHQDHVRTNNRWSNLRQVAHRDNGMNQRMSRANTSGAVGVRLRSDTGKWSARIKVNGKAQNLGCFHTFDEANIARKSAAAAAGFHASHGAQL